MLKAWLLGSFISETLWEKVSLMNVTETYSMLQVYESSDHGIFRVDDVFVTGMLAEKANVSHRDISDLITFYEDWDEEVSLFVCLFVCSHQRPHHFL